MPLGVNPHFLLDDTQIVSRRNVFKYEEESSDMKPDDELLGSLHGIIRESLDVDWSLVHDYEGSTKRKRRKAKHDSAGGEQMEFEFRLLSTVQTISLLHKPPPPAKFREPSYEDTEEQAELRRKMAEQVAVDVAWLQKAAQRESKVTPSLQATVPNIPTPAPYIMLLHSNKSPRKTRPPVPPEELKVYPYDVTAPVIAPEHKAKTTNFPIVGLNDASNDRATPRTKRRKCTKIHRPTSRFWHPSSELRGKCQGYAFGYSSGYSRNGKYLRDKLRKATLHQS